MTETIQTAMDRLMTISVEPQDYVENVQQSGNEIAERGMPT